MAKIATTKSETNSDHQTTWAWQDALFGGMILASLLGLVYVFSHR